MFQWNYEHLDKAENYTFNDNLMHQWILSLPEPGVTEIESESVGCRMEAGFFLSVSNRMILCLSKWCIQIKFPSIYSVVYLSCSYTGGGGSWSEDGCAHPNRLASPSTIWSKLLVWMWDDSVGWTGNNGLIDVEVCASGPPSRRDEGPFIPADAESDTLRPESVKEDFW